MDPNMPTGETMAEGDYSGAEASEGSGNIVTIGSDMLGGVTAGKGDKIRFCVTSDPDEDGNVEGYFESEDEGDEETWEQETIRKVKGAM